MVGYIYLLTDTTNGKQYVGQHHYDKEELDPNYHGSGRIVRRIYNKRPETIKEEYVKTCYSQRELDEWEKYFIFMNNTLHPNGYNLEEGGRGGIPSEETRRKLSEAGKGRQFSDKTRWKISEARKRRHNSDETRRKISEANKGNKISEEQKKKISEKMTNGKLSKQVLQYTLDGELVREWPSVNECGRNGFNQGNISACCCGKHKFHKGFIWKYKEVK